MTGPLYSSVIGLLVALLLRHCNCTRAKNRSFSPILQIHLVVCHGRVRRKKTRSFKNLNFPTCRDPRHPPGRAAGDRDVRSSPTYRPPRCSRTTSTAIVTVLLSPMPSSRSARHASEGLTPRARQTRGRPERLREGGENR